MAAYTVTRLAQAAGISRTTLLYYESIGLMPPPARSDAGYRRYGDDDLARLRQLIAYRDAGLPLARIGELLAGGAADTLLTQRLAELNGEIARLRAQQRWILRALDARGDARQTRQLDKGQWVALLRGSGADDAWMARWHALFEKEAPEAHQDFLESIGLTPDEIAAVRRQALEQPLE